MPRLRVFYTLLKSNWFIIATSKFAKNQWR